MEQPEYQLMYEREDSHWWYVGRRQLALTLIEQWAPLAAGATILDVGCGTGGNLEALSRYGQAVGLDISPTALDFARQRSVSSLTTGSGLRLPYVDGAFDLVTSFDVLYHRWITSDSQVLSELYRVLRPGGWLLLTDSAMPLLWSSHDQRYYARQRYTLRGMSDKVSRAGFELHLCSYINTLLLPFLGALRLTMDWLPWGQTRYEQHMLPSWLNQLFVGLRWLETAWLRRGGTFPAGSSLICLGQKPGPIDIAVPAANHFRRSNGYNLNHTACSSQPTL